MGKRGFPAQPKAIALLKGDHHKGRYPSNEEAVNVPDDLMPTVLPPPDDLGPTGKQAWIDLMSVLTEIKGLITPLDLRLLQEYCRHQDIMKEMNDDMAENGKFIYSNTGAKLTNPALSEYRLSEKAARDIGREFGFSPSSRSGLRLPQKKEVDPLDKFR